MELAFTEAVASVCFFVFSLSILVLNRKCLIYYCCQANPIALQQKNEIVVAHRQPAADLLLLKAVGLP